MPGTNNKFKNGKHGLFGAAEQANTALNAALLYIGHFNNQLEQQIRSYKENTQNIIDLPANQVRKTANYSFKKKFTDEEAANQAFLRMAEFKNSLANQNANHTENSRQFSGYLKLAEKLMDTERGDFGKAMSENPYLSNMISMLQNGPKINEQNPIQQTVKYLQNTNPVSGKQETGPLQNLNIFMAQVAGLLDREYEKQKINEHYTPEKEAAYLKKLDADFSKVLENLSDLKKLVREDGTSDYDEYLNAPLDVMTGKNRQAVLNRPDISGSIANIKGQKQAIRNGWGMNELGVLGSLNELKYFVDIQKAAALANASQPGAAEEVIQKSAQISEFSKKLDAFHAEMMSVALFHPSEKVLFADRYNDLLQTGGVIDDVIIRNKINQGKVAAKQAMEFGGVQPKKYEYSNEVILDRILEGEKAKHYNPLHCLNSHMRVYMNIIPSLNNANPRYFEVINNQYLQDMDPEYRDNNINILYMNDYHLGPPIRHYITENGSELTVRYSPDKKREEKEKQVSIDTVKKFHYIAGKQSLLDRNEIAEMERVSDLPLEFADIEKGSTLNALTENPMLIHIYSHVVSFDPYHPTTGGPVLKRWLNERNLFEPAMNLIASGTDFLDAEFEKQQLALNSWNEKKEKLYLAKVCEAIDKLEKNFDILKNASPDEQEDESVLIQGSLAHLTGTDSSTTTRDMREGVVAMSWVKEGIQKGWSSNDIQLLYYLGTVEGRIEKMKVRFQLRKEKSANKKNPYPVTSQEIAEEEGRKKNEDELTRKINFLDSFQKNQLKTFRENLFKHPIKSPADMLAAASRIEGFYQRYKDDLILREEENGINAFAAVKSACKFYIPRLKNQCIEEIRKAGAEGRDLTVEKNREFSVVQNNAEMNAALQNMKNINFDFNTEVNEGNREAVEEQKKQIENLTRTFLKKKLTNGMYKDAHPEYFKSSSPDYAVTKRRTDFYLNQYIEHLMKVMKPANTRELAELLEFGGHEDVLDKIRKKTKTDAVKSRMEAFTAGRPERKKNDPTMKQTIRNMENATGWLSGDLFPAIVDGLKKLEKMRIAMAKELREKYIASEMEIKFTGYEKKFDEEQGIEVDDLTKPLYEFKLPKEVKVDRRKLKEMTNLQADVYEKINKYLNQKKDLIRQKGGNPDIVEDAARLGSNGEKRYRCMLDAKKAVENQNLATTEFNNNGPSMLDIQILKEPRIIPADVNQEREKQKFENNMKYNLLKDTIDRQKKLAAVLNKELFKAEKLREEFIKNRTLNETYAERKLAFETAEENLRKAKQDYDRDLAESEDVGRDILPEIKQRYISAKNVFDIAKANYDDIKNVENLDSYRNFEQYKRDYEESLGTAAKHCLYIMTILGYPYRGVVQKEKKKVEPYVRDLEKMNSERSELDEILGRFGGRMEMADGRKYTEAIPEAKRAAFDRYKEKHPELQDKLHNFDTLQDRIIEEKQRLGYLANTETTEQTIQSVQQRLTKMHEDICKGYASKIAVDWMSNEDIRSKTVQFEQMVNDIVIAGGDGPKFNENSEMYAAFEDNIFDKTPFKEEFRKGMASMCSEQKPTAETIRRLSDSIIKTEIQKNYNDENKMENIRQMAIVLDSETYVKEEVNKHKQAVNGEIIKLPGANQINPVHGANPAHGANQANHAQNHAHHAAGPGMH